MDFKDICELLSLGEFPLHIEDLVRAEIDKWEIAALVSAYPRQMACMMKYNMSRVPSNLVMKKPPRRIIKFYD